MVTHRRFSHWQQRALRVTLLLLLVTSLAPALARMVSFAQGTLSPWQVLCVADASGLPGEAGKGMASPTLDHCPLCQLQQDAPGLLPVADTSQPARRVLQAVPRLYLQAPRPPFAWAAARPRGPPPTA